MKSFIKINPSDNVAVALQPLAKGTVIKLDNSTLTLTEEIMQGHKFALKSLKPGDSIIKYGNPIGRATAEIPAGSWIHTHNLKTGLGDLLTYTYNKTITELPHREPKFFQGYRRKNGGVGVRNEIWIIPTVGCVNNVASAIERATQKYMTDQIDGVCAFPHPYGCSQMGDDQNNTRQILADLVNHPNAGGVLVLGLGCENSNIDELKKFIGDYDPERVRFLVAQECEDEIRDGIEIVKELISYASSFKREPISASELVIGMKCGGSDGLSGITANPTVGAFSDKLISMGGSTILTEVPEMFGAEELLMNRCETEDLFNQTVALVNDFKNYFKSHNQTIYENPSPGNKEGGLTTLEEKSLGCIHKGGHSEVTAVYDYAKQVEPKQGLVIMDTPGNDPSSVAAMVAGGCQIVVFSTGRGTPTGNPLAPVIKITGNKVTFANMSDNIDIDASPYIYGTKTMTELGDELMKEIKEVADGKLTKAEALGYTEMAIARVCNYM